MTATINGNGKESLLNRTVTVLNLIVVLASFFLLAGGAFFNAWITLHDELLSLKKDVANNTATTELKFLAQESIEDRRALHKALDEFEASSIIDRRDLRERVIHLEAKK